MQRVVVNGVASSSHYQYSQVSVKVQLGPFVFPNSHQWCVPDRPISTCTISA